MEILASLIALSGWIGSILLAICAIPLAYQCFKQKHANGISNLFLTLWLVGEICTVIYILPKKDIPLLLNYGLNIVCLMVIVRYKFNKNSGS